MHDRHIVDKIEYIVNNIFRYRNVADMEIAESKNLTDDLMNEIAKGTFKPGQRLIEKQLCEFFNVKRSSLRESLRALEHEGFVRIVKNVGAFVAEASQKDIEEMYDLLSVLDGLAVKIATRFISVSQLQKLEKLIKKMETAEKPAVLSACNREFHTLICAYSENKRLIRVTDNLRLNISLLSYRNFFSENQKMTSIRDHQKIIQAMRQNKSDQAETLMREHILDAKYSLIKSMNKSL